MPPEKFVALFLQIIFQPITAPDLRWREILDILLVTKNDLQKIENKGNLVR